METRRERPGGPPSVRFLRAFVLTVLLAALTLGAAEASAAPWPAGVPDPDTLPTLAAPSARSHKDPAFSRIASGFARGPRAVLCWSQADWRLLVPEPSRYLRAFDPARPHQIDLSAEACGELARLYYRHQRPYPNLSTAYALERLALGAIRSDAGVHDDVANGCLALERVPLVGRDLGLPRSYGDELVLVLIGVNLARSLDPPLPAVCDGRSTADADQWRP